MAKSLRKAVHDKISVKVWEGDKVMTPEDAMKILGWRSETDPKEKEVFGQDYKFKDVNGVKVRLTNCETNRPLRLGLAKLYANEILRNKWRLNGETITVDKCDNVQSGQHRLVGLVLAEQIRKKNPEMWKQYGTRGPVSIEVIVVTGIDDSDDVVDTIDLGQKRTLGDVLFRNREFEVADESEQATLSKVLAGAVRVVWLGMGGKTVTSAPKLLHSVALDLIEKHERILDAVSFIVKEDGSEKTIRTYLSLPYAAGLMYLQATSKTKTEKFDHEGVEALDFSLWEKAEEFWTLLASGAGLVKGDPILVLRNFLAKAPQSGGMERDMVVAAVKLAWNAWIEGKKLEGVKDLKAETVKDSRTGKVTLIMPHMGGLDVERVVPETVEEEEEVEEAPKASKKAAKGKAATPKATKKAVKKAAGKGPKSSGASFLAGDAVHVQPGGKDPETGEAWPAYDARIVSVSEKGKITVTAGGENFELNPAEGDIVTHK